MNFIFIFFSYFLGAVPTGFIVFRLIERKDIRDFGSRATGATNILRVKGLKTAVPVALFDIAKGFFPVILALKIFPDKKIALFCGFSAIVGHCFPIYIKFKGGKGVATTVGAFAAVAIKPMLFIVLIFVIVVAVTRYVSLGSILAVLSFPVFVYFFNGGFEIIGFGLAVFLLVVFQHKGNISRIFNGNERKLGEKVK